jgi:hypothetical protein
VLLDSKEPRNVSALIVTELTRTLLSDPYVEKTEAQAVLLLISAGIQEGILLSFHFSNLILSAKFS